MLISGSYYGWLVLGIVQPIVKFQANLMSKYFHNYECARKLGAYIYEPNYSAVIFYNVTKIFMESFMDVLIMNFLQVNGWIDYSDQNFWGNPWAAFSQISTLFHLYMIIFVMIYVG